MKSEKRFSDYASERFEKEGWRMSAGVRNICEILESHENFLSQKEIANILQDMGKAVDYTTIYRILRKLQSLKLVHEFDQKWHRENEPANPLHGHFLICEETGYAEEIYLDYFNAIAKQLAKEKGFVLKSVKMAFFGQSDPKRRG
ncbi:MAG TPA: transcriptional repressor [Candidatus Gracilibacteria bacterium]